ncbi:unnamed protein product, partial [Urochloa humidicola]
STDFTEQSLLSSLLSHASTPPAPRQHAGVHPAGAAPPRRRSRASRAHPEYTPSVAALHTAPIPESPRVSTAPEPLEHASSIAGLLLWIRKLAPPHVEVLSHGGSTSGTDPVDIPNMEVEGKMQCVVKNVSILYCFCHCGCMNRPACSVSRKQRNR